eukprot:TRINITY_DN20009_c0_g1_i2.p1 TRINITY_DN20009_c0_g1~~TRINITY_DN20009_c0_g1_i2.p1  ORF type:complete len:614 (+),score=81.92 TRINITY_DN20009_c0_g1_i2:25-1866(+)
MLSNDIYIVLFCFFFFKQKTAYEIMPSLVGSEMCIRDRFKQRNFEKMFKRQEFSSRRNVILITHAFACLKSRIQYKELRSLFFNKLSIFYYNYLMKKYFAIIKSLKSDRIKQEQQNILSLALWKQTIQKKYFYHLKNSKVQKLVYKTNLAKKENIARLICTKLVKRQFFSLLRFAKQYNKYLAQGKSELQTKSQEWNKTRFFTALTEFFQNAKFQENQQLRVKNFYARQIVQSQLKNCFSGWKNEIKYEINLKQSKQQLRMCILKKYFNQFKNNIDEENQFYIIQSEIFQKKNKLQSFFSHFKKYVKSLQFVNQLIKQKNKKTLKKYFQILNKYTQQSLIQGRKEIQIRRSSRKTNLQIFFGKWLTKHEAIQSNEQRIKNSITKQLFHRKQWVFQFLRNLVEQRKRRKNQIELFQKIKMQIYFSILRRYTQNQVIRNEKWRKTRQLHYKSQITSIFQFWKKYVQKKMLQRTKQNQVFHNYFKKYQKIILKAIKDYSTTRKMKLQTQMINVAKINFIVKKYKFNHWKVKLNKHFNNKSKLIALKNVLHSNILRRIIDNWKTQTSKFVDKSKIKRIQQEIILKTIGLELFVDHLKQKLQLKKQIRGVQILSLIHI